MHPVTSIPRARPVRFQSVLYRKIPSIALQVIQRCLVRQEVLGTLSGTHRRSLGTQPHTSNYLNPNRLAFDSLSVCSKMDWFSLRGLRHFFSVIGQLCFTRTVFVSLLYRNLHNHLLVGQRPRPGRYTESR